MGNSDHSTRRRPGAGDVAHGGRARCGRAFVRDYSERLARSPAFSGPRASSGRRIDAWSGGKPGPWTRDDADRVVHRRHAARRPAGVDEPGLLYTRACGGWRVDPVKAELGPAAWDADVGRLAAPGAARPRRPGLDCGHPDRVLLGPVGVGRPAGRPVRGAEAEAAARRGAPRRPANGSGARAGEARTARAAGAETPPAEGAWRSSSRNLAARTGRRQGRCA